jgi:hypothetical protein
MTDRLLTALRAEADACPPFDLTADPWTRGRRARRRRRAGIAGSLVAAGVLVAGLAGTNVAPWSDDAPPINPPPEVPTLPDTLYHVPRHIQDVSTDPLGGPAALVYSGPEIRTGLWGAGPSIPVVVGAQGDVVRAVRDLTDTGRFAVSPDGSRLAAPTWGSILDGDWPTILVADLITGRTERHVLPDPTLGGEVEELIWSADGLELLISAYLATEFLDEMSYRGETRHLALEVASGQWRERAQPAPVAVSPDGRWELRRSVDWELEVAATDGAATATLEMPMIDGVPVEPTGGTAAFSPDGVLVAVWGSRPVSVPPTGANPHSIEVFDRVGGDWLGSVNLGGLGGGGILGWGAEGLIAWLPHRTEGTRIDRFDLADLDDVRREVIIRSAPDHEEQPNLYWSLEIPRSLLDADTRPAAPPDMPVDWVPLLPWLVIPTLAGLLLILRRTSWYSQVSDWSQRTAQSRPPD